MSKCHLSVLSHEEIYLNICRNMRGCVLIFVIHYIYIYLAHLSSGESVRKWSGKHGFNPSRMIPKTQKMVLDASLLNTEHYKVRIKGKLEQSGERSRVLPLHLRVVAIEKGAFGSSSTTGRLLYLLTIYIYHIYIGHIFWSAVWYFNMHKRMSHLSFSVM